MTTILTAPADLQLATSLERFYQSEDYSRLVRHVSESNLSFAQLPEKFKLVSLYMLQADQLDMISDSWRLFYHRKPPTFAEFLTPEFGGSFVNDMYNGWREVLSRDFTTQGNPQEIIFTGAIGLGKCKSYGEKILRYDGSYVEAQDVQVGEQLRGPDDVPRTVLKVGRGYGKLYRITTTKGESFTVNGNHQLMLKKLVRTYEKGKTHATRKATFCHETVQMSVLDLLKKSPNQIKNQYKLFKSPVNYAAKEHVLDPYFIGLLLGDGSLSGNVVVYSAAPEIGSYLHTYAVKHGVGIVESPSTGCTKYSVTSGVSKIGSNPIRTEVIRLGLMGKNWDNKSVPAEYKFDSRENRLQLLAGLLDTDGYYNPDGVFEFSNKSEQLARDVYEIALDLGFAAIIRYKPTNSQYVQDSPGWRVSISGDLDLIPTLIERKRAKPRTTKKNVLHHGIRSIEELPEGDYYGFEVDGDHLYLDDDRFVHHNTSIAAFLHVWNLLRVCLLINPQATLGVAFNTLLVLALFTVTLDKASLALIKPFTTLLKDSPFFVEVKKEDEFQDFAATPHIIPFLVRASGHVMFPRNIMINIGSTVTHAISYSMFGAMLDEAEFKGSVEESFQIYTNLKERIRSRFLGSRFTLLTLMSSARYSTGIIADYVKNVDPEDAHTKVYSFAIWDIKNFDVYKNRPWFKVLRGTAQHPHRMLTEEEAKLHDAGQFQMPEGCEILAVPEAYKTDFSGARIGEALQNLAGIPVLFTASYPFTDLSRLEHKALLPEVHIAVELGSKEPLIDRLPQQLFKTVFGDRRFAISPAASRIIALDLAETAEAGVSLGHLSQDEHGKLVVVYDLIMKVNSPTRIDIGLLRDLVLDLAKICHLYLTATDQFQSTLFRQEITLSGLVDRVELVSVDRTVEPYTMAARLVMNGQVLTGNCALLKKQLQNIQIDDQKSANKITGSKEFRKDIADSWTSVSYNAMMHVNKLTIGRLSDWMDVEKVHPSVVFKGMKAL